MSFLPVVERELRVSARKRSTFWLRVIAGLVALLIGGCFLWLSWILRQGTAGFGGVLFKILTWLALAAAVSAGFFFTADSLSEEKREGTLGFLFLTDLRGYDVAGGKLLATSLRGSYALLAFFPILATTLLMGGVTGAEFWKTTLALLNTLFVSLALGLLISAISWDSQKAMGATFLLLLLICAGGPLVDTIYSAIRGLTFRPRLSVLSPVYAFISAGAWGRSAFWESLWVTHLCGWAALALGSVLVRRTWQDRPRGGNRFWFRKEASSNVARPGAARRRRLLDRDPMLWLATRERWPAVAMCVLALIATAVFSLDFVFTSGLHREWTQFSWLLVLVLYLWTASLACRLFVETRRGGFLELLLVTPLSVKDAALGQWRAWRRLFALPILLLLVVNFSASWEQKQTMLESIAATAGQGGVFVHASLVALATAVESFSTVMNLIALSWFGMWMGLRSKNISLGVLKTFAFVEIIPWLVIYFVSTTSVILVSMTQVFRGATSGTMPPWFAVLIPLLITSIAAVLAIGKDIFFILWSRRRLYQCSREQAVLNLPRARRTVPAVAVPPLPPPSQPIPA